MPEVVKNTQSEGFGFDDAHPLTLHATGFLYSFLDVLHNLGCKTRQDDTLEAMCPHMKITEQRLQTNRGFCHPVSLEGRTGSALPSLRQKKITHVAGLSKEHPKFHRVRREAIKQNGTEADGSWLPARRPIADAT